MKYVIGIPLVVAIVVGVYWVLGFISKQVLEAFGVHVSTWACAGALFIIIVVVRSIGASKE